MQECRWKVHSPPTLGEGSMSRPDTDSVDAPQRVLWIGGAARSGKTTVANWLQEEYGITRYDGDRAAIEAINVARPSQPAAYRMRLMFDTPSLQPPFFEHSPEEIANDFLALGFEHFSHTRRQIEVRRGGPTVVDGFILRAGQVLEVANRDHIAFLFSTHDFQRDLWRKGGWHKNCITCCDDPDLAERNFIESMVCVSRRQRRECEELGVHVIETGGTRTIMEMIEAVRRLPRFLESD